MNSASVFFFKSLVFFSFNFTGYSGREVLVITADDKVYGVGMNSSGCLGLGDTNFHERPGEILSLSNKRVKGITKNLL